MTLLQIKNELKRMHEQDGRDLDLCNVAYSLIKTYRFSKSILWISENDLMMLVDNLWINNEILNSENIDSYDTEKIGITAAQIKKIKGDPDRFILLNYYRIDGKLINCVIPFSSKFNPLYK